MDTSCLRKLTVRFLSMWTIFQHTAHSLKPQGRKKSFHINLSQPIQQSSLLGHRQKCFELYQTNHSAFQERETSTKSGFSPFICRVPLQKAGFPVGWHTKQVNFAVRWAQAITQPHSQLINRNICEALSRKLLYTELESQGEHKGFVRVSAEYSLKFGLAVILEEMLCKNKCCKTCSSQEHSWLYDLVANTNRKSLSPPHWMMLSKDSQ